MAGDAGSRFCSGRRLGTETGLSERVPCRALDSAPGVGSHADAVALVIGCSIPVG